MLCRIRVRSKLQRDGRSDFHFLLRRCGGTENQYLGVVHLCAEVPLSSLRISLADRRRRRRSVSLFSDGCLDYTRVPGSVCPLLDDGAVREGGGDYIESIKFVSERVALEPMQNRQGRCFLFILTSGICCAARLQVGDRMEDGNLAGRSCFLRFPQSVATARYHLLIK